EPAIFTIKLIVVLTDFRSPGANAALGASNLEQSGLLLRECNLPIETVTTKIAQAATAVAIGLERIEHLARVILGVRSREHDRIVLQSTVTVVMKFPVG